MKINLLYLLYFISFQLFATQFVPIEMTRQLDESDAVLYGVFQGSHTKILADKTIVTVNSFKIKEIAGIGLAQMHNQQQFDVFTLGGTWQGKVVSVSGTPQFTPGEECMLLLKKTSWGWTVQNLALGKYSVVTVDGQKFLQSTVFPTHPLLGKVPIDYFHSMVFQAMHDELAPISHEKQRVTSNRKGHAIQRSRAPASIDHTVAKEDSDDSTSLIWLTAILALLGSIMTWIHSFAYDNDN